MVILLGVCVCVCVRLCVCVSGEGRDHTLRTIVNSGFQAPY